MLTRHSQRGFTILELLISLGASTLVIASVLAIFTQFSGHSRRTTDLAKLNMEIHKVTSLLTSDLRRAGYWASSNTSNKTNPFMDTGTDLQINTQSNCVLFSYDRNADGNLAEQGSGTDDERYGFRLVNGAIQTRPAGAPFDCNAPANTWTNLTDPSKITVTAFTITKDEKFIDQDGTGPKTSGIVQRALNIKITGQLVGTNTVAETVERTVKLSNTRYIAQSGLLNRILSLIPEETNLPDPGIVLSNGNNK